MVRWFSRLKRSTSLNRDTEIDRFFVVEAGFSATTAPVVRRSSASAFAGYDRQIGFERIIAMGNATAEDEGDAEIQEPARPQEPTNAMGERPREVASATVRIGVLALHRWLDDGSRMRREVHVGSCESLRVRFPSG